MKYLLSATRMTVTIGVPAPQRGFRSNACKSLIICEKTEAYWRPDGAAPAVGTNRDRLFLAVPIAVAGKEGQQIKLPRKRPQVEPESCPMRHEPERRA